MFVESNAILRRNVPVHADYEFFTLCGLINIISLAEKLPSFEFFLARQKADFCLPTSYIFLHAHRAYFLFNIFCAGFYVLIRRKLDQSSVRSSKVCAAASSPHSTLLG